MHGRDPTADGGNQRHTRTITNRASYRAGEILHSQQDLTTAVFKTSNFTFMQQHYFYFYTLTIDLLNLLHLEY